MKKNIKKNYKLKIKTDEILVTKKKRGKEKNIQKKRN